MIGNKPANANNSAEQTYSFTDTNPLENGFYRIAAYDLDSRVIYTGILHSSCNATGSFSIWPNPVHDRILINIVSGNESQVTIKIFDSRGALVKRQIVAVLRGSNQLNIDMAAFSNGVYSVAAEWDNGQMKKTVQLLKQ